MLDFEVVRGHCNGENLDTEKHLCEDIKPDNPVCIECQKKCKSKKDCAGFQVFSSDELETEKATCHFKKDAIIIEPNALTDENHYCFKKGTLP